MAKRRVTVIIVALLITICALFALFHNVTRNTDFPSFYRTAKIILNPDIPNTSIYERDLTAERYDYPSAFVEYRFSMFAAYLMAPLGLLPYTAAKTTMTFLNSLAYLAAVALTLRLCGASGRWLLYPLSLSLLWFPQIDNLRFAQVNSIMLLLVVLGVLAAVKNRPYLCGALIAIAALFKVFPLAIAMVLGLKNWRILAGCFAVFCASLLLPGAVDWFYSFTIQPFRSTSYSPILFYLNRPTYIAFAAIVAGSTALLAYRSDADYLALTAIAIPTMFLAAPIVEYYHLTMLVVTYIYLFYNHAKFPRWNLIAGVISILLITAGPWSINYAVVNFFGVFVLWLSQVYYMTISLKSTVSPPGYN